MKYILFTLVIVALYVGYLEYGCDLGGAMTMQGKICVEDLWNHTQ